MPDELAPERFHAADVNYADSWRLILAGSASGDARDLGGVMAASCGFRVRAFNVAVVTRPLDDPDAALAELDAHFAARELPYRLLLRQGLDPACERAARRRGLQHRQSVPGMLLHPIPRIPEPPGDLEILRVEDDAALAEFTAVAGPPFGIPGDLIGRFLNRAFSRHPSVALFLGRLEGEPVTTSALIRSGDVAGVYWVATEEGHRRRGLGEAMTWRAVAEGAAAGCDLASLQASELGAPVYARMGFRTLASYLHFDSPRPGTGETP